MKAKAVSKTQEKYLNEKVILPILIQWRWEEVCETLTLSKELTGAVVDFYTKEQGK